MDYFQRFVRVLGEAQPFYEEVTLYYDGTFLTIENLENIDLKVLIDKELFYCFYKGFALYFDEPRNIAYHYNRQQQQATPLGKAAVINRVKMAVRREQQGVLIFEATGKKVCLDNNTSWKTYWQIAETALTKS